MGRERLKWRKCVEATAVVESHTRIWVWNANLAAAAVAVILKMSC